MKTLVLCLSLALATAASAQLIPDQSIRDTMILQQFKDKLDEMQEQQSTDSARSRMLLEEEHGRLDDLNRKLDEMAPDNSEGR
jgi:hypothetical protein